MSKKAKILDDICNTFFEVDTFQPLAYEVLTEMQNDVDSFMTSTKVSWTTYKAYQLGLYSERQKISVIIKSTMSPIFISHVVLHKK
jgi:hypothetical protein